MNIENLNIGDRIMGNPIRIGDHGMDRIVLAWPLWITRVYVDFECWPLFVLQTEYPWRTSS